MALSFIGSTRPAAAATDQTATTTVTIPASPSITVPGSLTTIPATGTPTTAAPSVAQTPGAPSAPNATRLESEPLSVVETPVSPWSLPLP